MTTATTSTAGDLFAAASFSTAHVLWDASASGATASAHADERLARVEHFKRFAVLPQDWIADGDELTPTSKLKRREIAKYATEIEGMYAGS